jgi:type VI secretion system secreted protein VgrG
VGGASVTIEGGNITVECPGKILVQASKKSFSGPEHLSRSFNDWPTTNFDKQVVLKLHTGEPAANRKYEITREDGAVIRGVTDAQGRMPIQKGQFLGQLKVTVLE